MGGACGRGGREGKGELGSRGGENRESGSWGGGEGGLGRAWEDEDSLRQWELSSSLTMDRNLGVSQSPLALLCCSTRLHFHFFKWKSFSLAFSVFSVNMFKC